MSNAILPDTFAVLMVGSTLVYCYDVRRIYGTKKYYVQEEWNVRKSGHQYQTQWCIYRVSKKKTVYIYAICSGFYCSMETSRITGVGSRIYIVRIVAVSRITRTCTGMYEKRIARPENYMVLVLASKLTWSLCGW